MKIHTEKVFLLQPPVLVLVILLFIASSLAGNQALSLIFAIILTLGATSHYYLKSFQNKVSWSFKKYVNISSIDEQLKVFVEIKNESKLPIHNLKLTIESKSERDLIFINDKSNLLNNSMFSQSVSLLPNSQKIVEIDLKGQRRGSHSWTNFNIHITDPLHLQTLRLDYSNEQLPTFPVVPRIYKLNDLKLKSLLQGYRNANNSLFMDETSVIGTKDYENESFRHIHWIASAKENKLLAKKYQKVNGDNYSVFLNLVGKGQFHLRKDMEELIEYAVSVCLYLIKEGCKVKLLVNYLTQQREILTLDNDIDRTRLKDIIEALSLVDDKGIFLPNAQFYQQGFLKMDSKSLALIIGIPPSPTKINQWLHLKQ